MDEKSSLTNKENYKNLAAPVQIDADFYELQGPLWRKQAKKLKQLVSSKGIALIGLQIIITRVLGQRKISANSTEIRSSRRYRSCF